MLFKNFYYSQNKLGDSPLHIAASRGHEEVVDILLNYGADATLRNNDKLLAEDLANKTSIKNAIQMSKQDNDRDYGYGADDYNDDSD